MYRFANGICFLRKKSKAKLKRISFDDIRQWTVLKDYSEVKRSAENTSLGVGGP